MKSMIGQSKVMGAKKVFLRLDLRTITPLLFIKNLILFKMQSELITIRVRILMMQY